MVLPWRAGSQHLFAPASIAPSALASWIGNAYLLSLSLPLWAPGPIFPGPLARTLGWSSKIKAGVSIDNPPQLAMKDFFDNVARYPRYLVSFSLGILYNAMQPLVPLFQRPATAIALLGATMAGFLFLTFTLRAMLGLDHG